MQIVVNGEKAELREEMALGHWVETSGLNPNALLIEHNGKIIPKAEWKSVILHAGDQVELLQFVGGG